MLMPGVFVLFLIGGEGSLRRMRIIREVFKLPISRPHTRASLPEFLRWDPGIFYFCFLERVEGIGGGGVRNIDMRVTHQSAATHTHPILDQDQACNPAAYP